MTTARPRFTAQQPTRPKYFTYSLNLDAQGNVAALDARDFTTRATYLYSVKLDPLGNAYIMPFKITDTIAVVPFDALPPSDDPGLTC